MPRLSRTVRDRFPIILQLAHFPGLCLKAQNSILPWKAIMRGELSPPRPTPSRPVGGEMVLVSAPKPV